MPFTPAKTSDQNTLRKTKDFWNKKVSLFITKFMEYKKQFNGRQSALSNMAYPLPIRPQHVSEFKTLTSVVSKEFDSIAKQAYTIIYSQNAYAKMHEQGNYKQKKSDSVFDEIVSMKREWNATGRLFIKNLIEFKKWINGFPNEFVNEKTYIHKAFVGNPEKTLQTIQEQANHLFHYAVEIIETQYAIVKRSSDEDLLMVKEASNPLSRFVSNFRTYVKSFGGSTEAQFYGFKSSFVSILGRFKRKLRDVESDVLAGYLNPLIERDKKDIDAIHLSFSFIIMNYIRFLRKLADEKDPSIILFHPDIMSVLNKKDTPLPMKAIKTNKVEKTDPDITPKDSVDQSIQDVSKLLEDVSKFQLTPVYKTNAVFQSAVSDILKSSDQYLANPSIDQYQSIVSQIQKLVLDISSYCNFTAEESAEISQDPNPLHSLYHAMHSASFAKKKKKTKEKPVQKVEEYVQSENNEDLKIYCSNFQRILSTIYKDLQKLKSETAYNSQEFQILHTSCDELIKNIKHWHTTIQHFVETNVFDDKKISTISRDFERDFESFCHSLYSLVRKDDRFEAMYRTLHDRENFIKYMMNMAEFNKKSDHCPTTLVAFANVFNISLFDQLRRHFNKANFMSEFGQMRNYVSNYAAQFREIVDELLGDIERVDVVDYELLSRIVKITHSDYTMGTFSNELSYLTGKEFDESDSRSFTKLDKEYTFPILQKTIEETIRTWKMYEENKKYYRHPPRRYQEA